MTGLNAKLIFPHGTHGYSIRNERGEALVKLIGVAAEGRDFVLPFEPKLGKLCDLVSEDFLEMYPFNVQNSLKGKFGFIIGGMEWLSTPKKSGALFEVKYTPAWFNYLN